MDLVIGDRSCCKHGPDSIREAVYLDGVFRLSELQASPHQPPRKSDEAPYRPGCGQGDLRNGVFPAMQTPGTSVPRSQKGSPEAPPEDRRVWVRSPPGTP